MFAFSRLKTAYCIGKIIAFLCGKAMRLTTDITNVVVAGSFAFVKTFVSPSLIKVLLQLLVNKQSRTEIRSDNCITF